METKKRSRNLSKFRKPKKREPLMMVTLIVTLRDDRPHVQCFGESISLDDPSPAMLGMFYSFARTDRATFEVNGKEWKPDEQPDSEQS